MTSDGAVHSRQLGTETDYYEEEWYAETKLSGEEYWCEPYFDEGGAKIMICTFSVPIMDGYEATGKIREMYPDAYIPIIALSANAFEEDRAKSIEAGMNDYVAKPVNLAELKRVLGKYI